MRRRKRRTRTWGFGRIKKKQRSRNRKRRRRKRESGRCEGGGSSEIAKMEMKSLASSERNSNQRWIGLEGWRMVGMGVWGSLDEGGGRVWLSGERN